MPQFTEKFEVIVVDDGSIDQTAFRLKELAKKYENFRIITHERDRA